MHAHFSPQTMRFLRDLGKHNDRVWFEERRPLYEQHLKQPLHALIDEINHELADFAPEYVRPAHKIAMRIFRDTRFSPDKRPYKTHLAAWWARQGYEKTSAPGFFLQVGPAGSLVAAGIYAPERDELLAIRRWFAEHHDRYRHAVAPMLKPSRKLPGMQLLDPNALTRNPKGFPPGHPADDLLRARNHGVKAELSPENALQPTFSADLIAHFRRAFPLVTLLQEPFEATKSARASSFLR